MQNIIITGGSGFIGSALTRLLLKETNANIINIDAETYACSPDTNAELLATPRYQHLKMDICDREAVLKTILQHRPTAIFHLAAESHVDRSITGADTFIQTNIIGTYNLLEASRNLQTLQSDEEREAFRFMHISTDEVFGSIDNGQFTEQSPLHPNSPYSGSKAASDMLAFAWHGTYKLPVIITNCSNNYGPRQFPEKLIPLMILNALNSRKLPVYGDGKQVRDWLHVEDHATALFTLYKSGTPGQRYNIGSDNERTNIEIVTEICRILDELNPSGAPHANLIQYVTDRPGHDRRYATDASYLTSQTGWKPAHNFEQGLRDTIQWYLDNQSWWADLYAKLTPPSFLQKQ
jgi:dTDP-glucose 4,6-dehydratase